MSVELTRTLVVHPPCGEYIYEVQNTTLGTREEPLCVKCDPSRFAKLVRFARVIVQPVLPPKVKLPEGVKPDGTRDR